MTDRDQYTPGPAVEAQSRKERREVDAHSRQRAAPPAGKSLAGADRPGASARVGALWGRPELGCGWSFSEAHLGGNGECFRNKGDAGRRSQAARIFGHPVGVGADGQRHAPDAVAQHRSPVHLQGRGGLAHLLRCAGSPSRRSAHWTHRRPRRHEVRAAGSD